MRRLRRYLLAAALICALGVLAGAAVPGAVPNAIPAGARTLITASWLQRPQWGFGSDEGCDCNGCVKVNQYGVFQVRVFRGIP